MIEAAQLADVHDMILQLPQGYDTDIGEAGRLLSAGQRQRIGLARALFGRPRLVVLDEPNSNLDQDGEAALNRAIAEIKAQGTTIVLIAHRPSMLAACRPDAAAAQGAVEALGKRDEIMKQITRPTGVPKVAPRRSGRRSSAGRPSPPAVRSRARWPTFPPPCRRAGLPAAVAPASGPAPLPCRWPRAHRRSAASSPPAC